MTQRRPGRKGRPGIAGKFVALPHSYINTQEFAALSGRAIKLLVELEMQYTGTNNGDLCATYGLMNKRGFTSADQLGKARDELVSAGWILVTRQGGRHIPSLYGLTYRGIDPCGGKLDVRPDPMPLHLWKPDKAHSRGERGRARKANGRGFKAKPLNRDTVQCEPRHGPILNRDTVQAK